MKMRDLIRYVEPTTTAPAWPPPWIGSFSLADPVLMPGRAILESFARVAVGTQLIIVIRFDTREYIGVLSWDAPPSLPAIEHLLQANIGRGIGVIGELDVWGR